MKYLVRASYNTAGWLDSELAEAGGLLLLSRTHFARHVARQMINVLRRANLSGFSCFSPHPYRSGLIFARHRFLDTKLFFDSRELSCSPWRGVLHSGILAFTLANEVGAPAAVMAEARGRCLSVLLLADAVLVLRSASLRQGLSKLSLGDRYSPGRRSCQFGSTPWGRSTPITPWRQSPEDDPQSNHRRERKSDREVAKLIYPIRGDVRFLRARQGLANVHYVLLPTHYFVQT